MDSPVKEVINERTPLLARQRSREARIEQHREAVACVMRMAEEGNQTAAAYVRHMHKNGHTFEGVVIIEPSTTY